MRKCKYCGCTDDHACVGAEGPCCWINGVQAICSACYSRMSNEDLAEAMAIETRRCAGHSIDLELPPELAIVIVGTLQLANRDPNLPAVMKSVVKKFVDSLHQRGFGPAMPAHQETIRRGNAELAQH